MSSRYAAVFADEASILAAIRAAREKGLVVIDAFTPHPVHGMDEALGLVPTRLPVACFVLGVLGALSALGFQLWTFGVDWPLNVGGKSRTAFPALVPVAFEVAVLFAALGTVLLFFFVFGLAPGKRPRLAAHGITDDRFVLLVDSESDPSEIFRELGAVEVTRP